MTTELSMQNLITKIVDDAMVEYACVTWFGEKSYRPKNEILETSVNKIIKLINNGNVHTQHSTNK